MGVVVLGLVLWPMRVDALNPALDIDQYAHTAWKIRDGFYKGTIHAIAQTPDGYLWLGSDFGLLRFDGVRMVPWRSPGNDDLINGRIQSLLTARDGRLWIGADGGLASWKDGKLTRYPALAGQEVPALLEDREGTVWVGVVASPAGRLCEIHDGTVRCHGDDGRFGNGARSLYEDSAGNLWVGAADALWRWSPGPSKRYPMPGWVNSLSEDDDGKLLISVRTGVKTLVGEEAKAYPLPGGSIPDRLYRDRDGGLWVVIQTGLVLIHPGGRSVFTPSDGLSGPNVSALFEDREGNIWVATTDGLDRFRSQAVVPISAKQGLADANHVSTVLGATDGSVWVGNFAGLTRWDHERISAYRPQGSTRPRELRESGHVVRDIADSGLPSGAAESLFEDHRRRIWVTTPRAIAYLENGRFSRVKGVPGGPSAMAEDRELNLWISNVHGLFCVRDASADEQIPWARVGRQDYASSLAADPVHGGLWLGFSKGGVSYFKDARVGAAYTEVDGLGKGRVNGLSLDRNGALWAATDGGLSRIQDGHVTTLTSKNGLPCDTVDWMMEDNEDSFWLNMDCGLVRIAGGELRSWVEDSSRTVNIMVFDSSDGVKSHAFYGYGSPRVGKSADGRIWFSTFDGLRVVDPRHLPVNTLPPPVHVEALVVDDQAYDVSNGVRLPPRTNRVTIDYTALSLVAPEKVRFRFKLHGEDEQWQEVTRRQASYTNLSPGSYRFQVLASNDSGMWNEAGAELAFSITPAYYQTSAFRALCVVVFVGVLWGAWQVRLRQLQRQLELTLRARVAERTRIARDLHDTLLQDFQAVVLMFQSGLKLIPDRPVEASRKLQQALTNAIVATTTARNAVQDLRSPDVESDDLVRSLTKIADEVTSEDRPAVQVSASETPLPLQPMVRGEVYRIAAEALRNALQHAAAHQVLVDIRYDRRALRVRVRDDGIGIDDEVLGNKPPARHFGLHGMRERAEAVGGRLDVLSKSGEGTLVDLSIPADAAYAASRRRAGLFRLLAWPRARHDSVEP